MRAIVDILAWLLAGLSVGCGASAGPSPARGGGFRDAPPPAIVVGSTPAVADAPAAVSRDRPASPVVDVFAGEATTCVLHEEGTALCWGRNGAGQLGFATAPPACVSATGGGVDGTMCPGAVEPSPTLVPHAVGRTASLTLGCRTTCAVLVDGQVLCWGSNFLGLLGAGGFDQGPSPRMRAILDGGHVDSDGCYSPDPDHSYCASRRYVSESRHGRIEGGPAASELALPGPAARVGLGEHHGCASTRDGAVWCWGASINGALPGEEEGTVYLRPHRIAALDDVVDLAVGRFHACVVREGGAVACWGNGELGQLGGGPGGSSSPAPRPVPGVADATRIAAGEAHTCALTREGRVRCWGDNSLGQLGDGSRAARSGPVEVAGLEDVVQIGLGLAHGCALVRDGSVHCWGANEDGRAGEPATEARPGAAPVPGLPRAGRIAVGHAHSCALVEPGEVRCWGDPRDGALGAAR